MKADNTSNLSMRLQGTTGPNTSSSVDWRGFVALMGTAHDQAAFLHTKRRAERVPGSPKWHRSHAVHDTRDQ